MSVTQDYKENNLLTFTFTPDEVRVLAQAALIGAMGCKVVSDDQLAKCDLAGLEESLTVGEALLSAHDKLVRK